MLRINLLSDTCERRALVSRRSWSRLVSRIPKDEIVARLDRRIFRWVLCGQHGFGRNWREECPQCAGYVERMANPHAAARMDQISTKAEEAFISAAVARTVTPLEVRSCAE